MRKKIIQLVIINDEGQKVCDKCESPYYLGDDDLRCTLVQDCAVSSEDSTTCLKCGSGTCLNRRLNKCQINYYLDDEEDNSVCYFCLDTSNDGTKCETCEEDFIPSEKGFCIEEFGCAKREGNTCLECKQDVIVKGNYASYCLNHQYECMRSVEGCYKCDNYYNPGNCTECSKGYYLEEHFHYCYLCKVGCVSCTDDTNCGGCKEGYYTVKEATTEDSYDAICGKCVEGCKVCTDNLDCEICYSGYFLNNNNIDNRMKCSKCSDFCEECIDESYCLKCKDGKKLVL